MYRIFAFALAVEFLFAPLVLAEDLKSANFIIRNPTVDNSGGWNSSASFQSLNTLGQPTTGETTSANFKNQSGFGYIHDPVFTLSAPASISYASIPVSTATQVTAANIADINIINTRGTNNAWSVTINVTNITKRGSSSKITGDNDTVSFTGTYTGVTAPHAYGKYTVEITTGGAIGAAIFKWTDPAGTIITGVTTASSVLLNNGITVNFGAATYIVGDKWILRVDSVGYTNLTVTPGAIITNYGNTNATAGSSGTFSGAGITSNARTLISATAGNGEGSYTQTPGLSQSIHANTMSGEFNGTITLTIS